MSNAKSPQIQYYFGHIPTPSDWVDRFQVDKHSLDVVEAVQQHAAFLYERGGKMTSMIKKIYIQCIGRIGGAKIKFIENPFTVIITTPLMKRDQTIITLYLLTQRHPVICNNTL
ncbi:uncharacterized protein LOC143910800 [Arctopsyche grandis]|uniref:uncharacterized protein LOC143910800 n=1 Tax=Arctopsyche grandis TaxID=121162 RepID=UPI00406D88A5